MLARRHLLPLAALALPRAGRAQAWPSRPVTLVVPWAPGGSNDVVARLLAAPLEARFGQPFVVENRPGGGGSLGMGAVVRARPDGQTLLISSASNHLYHPLIAGDLGYDPAQALAAVCMLTDVPNVLAVANATGVTDVPGLIAKAKAMPGMAFASSGVGSSNHLAGELFRLRTGLDLTHVPYRGGGQAIADLIAGTVPMAFLNLPTVLPPALDGRCRIIGVGTERRVPSRPEIPTIQEQGVADYAVRSWTGLFAPKETPAAVIAQLAAACAAALAQPAIRQRLIDTASEPLFLPPGETARFVAAEYARWGPVVKAANVKLDQ